VQTILIVEDQQIVALDLQYTLQSLGYAISGVAASGPEALAIAAAERPDLVLMDVRLRGDMDGIATAQALRARHDLPVVYLTAHNDEVTRARAAATTPYGFLVKPFDERALQTTIEMALVRHTADCEVRARERWFATTLANIGDAVVTAGADGIITFVNPAAARLFGLDAAAVVGLPIAEVTRFADDVTREQLPHPAVTALRAGTIVKLKGALVLAAEVTPYFVECSAIPIDLRADATLGVVLVAHDITEHRDAAQRLREANVQLTASVAALEQKADELQHLNHFGEMLGACRNAEDAYAVTAQYARRLFPNTAGILYIRRPPHLALEGVVSWGEPPTLPILLPDDCWGLRLGHAHLVYDTATDAACPHSVAEAGCSTGCIPLIGDGQVVGVLSLYRPGDQPLTEAHLLLGQAMAGRLELALANLALQERLRTQAVRDALTGLFNRRYLEEMLERALAQNLRSGALFGVLMIDIDSFKQVNDAFGHDAGDAVLRRLGEYLRSHVRATDVAARYGGEEFVVVLLDADATAVCARAEALRAGVIGLMFEHRGQHLDLTVSIGVAFSPTHGRSTAELLAYADAALYTAKRSGRNRVVIAPIADADQHSPLLLARESEGPG
jgi:diguanylate cyclase (GGDEF)-like protein/PAS domain S-box-containing protein